MRLSTRLFVLMGVATLAACASQGPPSSGAPAQASTASAGAHAIPDGYQREVVNGEERYCRNDFDTGSRVQRTKVCLTWEQLQAQERSTMQFSQQRTSPDD